eukprot:TRINITY_DN23830_c0_g1_i1.p1 TRINITY_DN23830_c0_g1~~TRINITY_DN23830_c0_g1_i1.p1  ORF type:complete len:469 (-),score=77.11 TRINITY_DN23830_c0_g1_i1:209-1615(-)
MTGPEEAAAAGASAEKTGDAAGSANDSGVQKRTSGNGIMRFRAAVEVVRFRPLPVVDDSYDAADSSDDDLGRLDDDSEAEDEKETKARGHGVLDVAEDPAEQDQAAPEKQTDSLPQVTGWMHLRQSCMVGFSNWHPLYFVLDNKTLQWYESEDPSAICCGVIDFDLVACQVDAIYKTTNASSAKVGRTCICSPFAYDNNQQVIFCIRPLTGDRGFVLMVYTTQEADKWVSAIQEHIDVSHGAVNMPKTLDVIGKRWWKVRRITNALFQNLADAGDILLFRSKGKIPKVQRTITGGDYDHIAFIVRLRNKELAILEATSTFGVTVCSWKEFLANGWQNSVTILALRRVIFDRTAEKVKEFYRWSSTVVGKPYSLSYKKLKERNSMTGAENPGFFCSELVAEGLKVLGVLPHGLSSTQYWPGTFSVKQNPPVTTLPGTRLDGSELYIDFSDYEAPAAADAKARDGLIAWK